MSARPLTNFVTGNLLLNNYNSLWPIDHDDGSSFYEDSYNVCIYGGFKQYLGHNKEAHHQLYLYPDANRFDAASTVAHSPVAVDGSRYGRVGMSDWGTNCAQYFVPLVNVSGWAEQFHDNTCVGGIGEMLSVDRCDFSTPSIIPLAYNNTVSDQHHQRTRAQRSATACIPERSRNSRHVVCAVRVAVLSGG